MEGALCIFIHCVLLTVFSLTLYCHGNSYSGELFCYTTKSNVCAKTSRTYGEICFTSYTSCRKFTYLPPVMWHMDKKRRECVQAARPKPFSNRVFFKSKEDCEKRLKRMTKNALVNSHESTCRNASSRCDEASHLNFAFNRRKNICILYKVRTKQSAYSNYRHCAIDNAIRFCISKPGEECIQHRTGRSTSTLCFAKRQECNQHSTWMSELWFFNMEFERCTRTLPHLKLAGVKYHATKELCGAKNVTYCYEKVGTICTKTAAYDECNPLLRRFFTQLECLGCLYNPGHLYHENGDYKCDIQRKARDIRQSFCSLEQCRYFAKMHRIKFSPVETGKYYLYGFTCSKQPGKTINPAQAFKTRSECIHYTEEEKKLMKALTAYEMFGGWCLITMQLTGPNIYRTSHECENAAKEHKKRSRFMIVYLNQTCLAVAPEVIQSTRDYVFLSDDDCERYHTTLRRGIYSIPPLPDRPMGLIASLGAQQKTDKHPSKYRTHHNKNVMTP